MDALAELLDGVRARGALFGRSVMDPPWALRFAADAPLTLTTMLRGSGWVVPGEGEPVPLGPGDVAVVRGPAPHTVADDPGTRPQYLITRAEYCATADGSPADITLAPRTCGPNPDGSALLLSGAYDGRSGVGERLLRALPGVLVVPGDADLLERVAREVASDRPGQQVVLDRLLDVLLLTALRSWFDRPGADAPGWYRALADPVVGRALRLLHDHPAHPWTVAGLAARTGLSRAAFARRFTEQVGEPPMAYLAGRRIDAAADLLRSTDATVESVARRVGYANAFALSVAFKRLRGVPPAAYRAAPDRRAG